MKTKWMVLGILALGGGLTVSAAAEPVPSSKGIQPYEAGVSLMDQGKFEEAIPVLEKAIELDPELAMAYYAVAVCQARKKSPEPALAREWHRRAIAHGYERNEWLETYCDQLDKKGK